MSANDLVGRHGVARAPAAVYNYDMAECPTGRKCILLTEAGIAVLGASSPPHKGYIAWAPLPDRNPDVEKAKGIR